MNKRRNLKSQIQRDAKRVFMNLDDFATLEHIRYYRNGNGPPVDMRIAAVVDEDETESPAWDKRRGASRGVMGNDQTLFRRNAVMFCAREDFDPPPKDGRKIQVGTVSYKITGVGMEGGLLRIGLQELDE